MQDRCGTADLVPLPAIAQQPVDLAKLRFELGRRGRRPSDLTVGPHRVSKDTLTRLLRNGRATTRSLDRIGRMLLSWPVRPELTAILSRPDRGLGSSLDARLDLEPAPVRGQETA